MTLPEWLGPAARARVERVAAAVGRLGPERAERYVRAEAARAHPQFLPFIQYLLEQAEPGGGETLFERDGVVAPVRLVGGPVEVELARPVAEDVRPVVGWESLEYVGLRQVLGRPVEDKPVYELRRAESLAGRLRLWAGLSTYGSALGGQDALEWELVDGFARAAAAGEIDFARLRESLSLRRAAEAAGLHCYSLGAPQGNSLAISTVIVRADADGRYRVLFGRRSARCGAHAGMFHAAPACIFQPEAGHVQAEWDVRHSVLKEYGEELFGFDYDIAAARPDYIRDAWPGVRALGSALGDGRALLCTTGLVVSALNLRPEVCALLLVRDFEWWCEQAKGMRTNWEYEQDSGQVVERPGGRVKGIEELDLDKAEQELGAMGEPLSALWVPAGLGALWLAIDKARELLGREAAD